MSLLAHFYSYPKSCDVQDSSEVLHAVMSLSCLTSCQTDTWKNLFPVWYDFSHYLVHFVWLFIQFLTSDKLPSESEIHVSSDRWSRSLQHSDRSRSSCPGSTRIRRGVPRDGTLNGNSGKGNFWHMFDKVVMCHQSLTHFPLSIENQLSLPIIPTIIPTRILYTDDIPQSKLILP